LKASKAVEARLAAAGVPTPGVDAEWLVAHVTGRSRSELAVAPEPTTEQAAELDRLVERRAAREPLAYVLGEWGFRGLTLKVDSRVLVPRPETETVVERCLELIRGVDSPAVLDVGTGSGAIALAIAHEHPGARVTAIDVSPDALELARENAGSLDVHFELRDARDGLGGPFDLVVSNPPYVSPDEIDGLEPEVRDWEPRLATVGKEHTGVVARGAAAALVPGGWLVLEAADTLAEDVAALLRGLGYAEVAVGRDLSGRDRVVQGRWTP
jgi:release factor glutamine methyltransferase